MSAQGAYLSRARAVPPSLLTAPFFFAAHPAHIASSQRYQTQKNDLMRDLSERLDLAEGPYPKKLVEHARIFVKGRGGSTNATETEI